jgi:glutamine cyclotransferase
VPTGAAPYPAPTALANFCLPDDLPPAQPPAVEPAEPISRTVQAPIPRYRFEVVNTYPHDRGAFTEGLQYVDGALYEGTGLNGKSELRRVTLQTGAVEARCALQGQFFGEGVTVLGGRIYQLTWQNHLGFVYDQASFKLLSTFGYTSEGWGLTNDGQRLIMSDGTARIHFLDPQTLRETGHIDVYDDHGPVVRLNELEYVRGEIYANVWQTDQIARIDPQSGQVLGWIDLGGLLSADDRREPVDVLNGIAYDAAGDRLFVTGKLWPKLFEIRLVPAS